MTKTFWISFVDTDKPKGERFLGVAIVEVTDEDVAAMQEEIELKFPNRLPGAEWIAAALRHAHDAGCNPGGQPGSIEMDEESLKHLDGVPRDRLLSKDELRRLDLI